MELGDLAGRYRIDELVGEGGMGRVFRAYDTKLRRAVAIKLLRADSFPSGSAALDKILREARLAATLDHPGAVAIYDVVEDASGPFIVMEFVVGRSLRHVIEEGGISLAERLRWLIDIAKILSAAHRLGLVHRDIKPENVMVRADGSVKLLDFGIALQMRDPDAAPGDSSSRGAGTPRYMAPEQIQRRVVDARTDQFAWGVVAYELLGGALPWRSLADGAPTAVAIVTERQLPLSSVAGEVPHRLDEIVDRALEKAPARRFASMDELASALGSVVIRGKAPDRLATLPDLPRSQSPISAETRPSDTREPPRRSAIPSFYHLFIWAGVLGLLGGVIFAVVLSDEAESTSEPESDWHAGPEAQAAFDEGMRRFRGAALYAGSQKFAVAVEYEPEFAAAWLRLGFIQMFDGPHPAGTEAFHTASRLRRRLDAKDQQLLDALEPAFNRTPPELDEAARRLELLASYYSSDVELNLIYALTSSLAGHSEPAQVAHRALLDSGAQVATAWLDLAYSYGSELRLDDARDAVTRCVEMAPDAIDCIWYGTKLDAFAGRCDAMEAGARTWMDLGPEDHGAPLTLISALIAQNAEPAKIEEAETEAKARMTLDSQAYELGLISAGRSILAGKFDEADRVLAKLPNTVRLEPRRLVSIGELRVALHEEMNDLAGASAIAADYRRLKSSLLGEGYDPEGDLSYDSTPYFDAILLAAGEIGRDEFEHRRQQWLASWRERAGTAFDDLLWQRAYAETTRNVADAHEALAEFTKLDVHPRFVSDRLFIVDTANVYVLAGLPDRAVPLLRDAVRSCLGVTEPLRFVRAQELLGRALEAIGDREGACAAYASVLARWGHAVPSSRTASAAAERSQTLACDAR